MILSPLLYLGKSYDFRAIYPNPLNAEFFTLVGKAFATWAPGGTVFIGGDARLSTPELKTAMIDGLVSSGRSVVDLWLVSSDMLQFASLHYASECALAIMITASHNPKEYNGFKCCLANAVPINLTQVGKVLEGIIESQEFTIGAGSCEPRDILPDWIDRVARFAESDLSHLRIVADAGNGVAGVFMPELARTLGFELIPLFFEPDGNFPNHHPSPIEPKNMEALIARVRETGADIWVAFDGDADRAVMCDSTGAIISPSITMAAIAEYFLHLHPGGTILTNTPTSHIVRDTVGQLGGKTLIEKVGNVYLKARMQQDPSIIFAGEHSSHYFFSSLGNLDSWVVAFVIFLEYMSQFELTAEAVRTKFSTYANIPETNFTVKSVSNTLTIFAEKFADGIQDTTDGLTITYPTWWMSIRGSSNEPLIRVNLEADTQEILETQKALIFGMIGKIA